MKNIDQNQKSWVRIIQSIKGPLSFLALAILCFQVIILALINKTEGGTLTILALSSSVVVIIAVSAVGFALIRKNNSPKAEIENETVFDIRKVRLFFTTPLSGYSDEETFSRALNETLDIVKEVRNLDRVESAYYFNEQCTTLEEFENADLSVPEYLNEIDQCDYFILIAEDRFFASIHFEAGYALAKGKKSIYFVKNNECIPYLMKHSSYAYPRLVRLYEYSSPGEIIKVLRNKETYI